MVKKLKLLNKIGKFLIFWGWILWAVETITFLIIYGLHLKTITETERLLDNIAFTMMFLGIIVLFSVIHKSNSIILDMMEESEEELNKEEEL